MPSIFRPRFGSVVCVSVLLFAACGSGPVLMSKSAVMPSGVDFSGQWRTRENPVAIRLPGHQDRIDPVIRASRPQRRESRRRMPGTSAQVFLELGELLRISQTESGLFISYDRSVVEEYRFGENRTISVGPIVAQRVSGWDGSAFVVETLDDDGSILFERWHLKEDGSVLVRNIRIANGDREIYSLQRLFDRK